MSIKKKDEDEDGNRLILSAGGAAETSHNLYMTSGSAVGSHHGTDPVLMATALSNEKPITANIEEGS